MAKKNTEELRPVQDYREINEWTIPNKYPLPLISELIDQLQGAKYFTKVDVKKGYNNVRIAEGDEWKAAFKTNMGLFEPTVMFFGLCNSPATFQMMMNEILREEIEQGHVRVYMDDIIIFHRTIQELREITDKVFKKLIEHNLYLQPEKCEFEKEEIEFLGIIVSEGKVRMDPVKVSAVKEWPTPKKKKDVQSFLGFTNFYRRFIKDYGKIAKPLTELTGKQEWKWTDSQGKAFAELKKRLMEELVLLIPDNQKPFRVEADASLIGMGAVLWQPEGEVWKPAAYMLKAFTPTERNYTTEDREMLAVMKALRHWKQYLQGAMHKVEIQTDHLNLTYFKKPQDLN